MLKTKPITMELIKLREKRQKEWTAQEKARMNVIKKAIKLAHNANRETHGGMLPDERELYDAVT